MTTIDVKTLIMLMVFSEQAAGATWRSLARIILHNENW